MKNCFFVLCFLLFVPIYCSAQITDKNIFIYPLSIQPSLSASFAELRDDHFHSGLDLKTGGTIGKEVKCAADGYVYRISVSPFGFGNAIYIRHSNGYSTVYGHLDHFRKDIAGYVEANQYALKSFAITLYPERDKFPVRSGDIIAWSGNSGGSAGPHLHFEIRESSTENPVNPLLFNLGVTDGIKPAIDKVIIYPVTHYSSVNNSHSSLAFKATGASGRYSIAADQVIRVNGLIGFGIKTWDTFDGSQNKCGVYKIRVEVDSSETYEFTANRFSYSESRYINSHIDYSRRIENNEYIHKLWLEPGNKLSMYDKMVNRGLTEFNDDRVHLISIAVSDARGNVSKVNFKVRSLTKAPVKPAEMTCDKIVPFGKSADFESEGIKVHIPANALYDTLCFKYGYKPKSQGFLSGIHQVHNESTAINDVIRISIKPDSIPHGLESKLYLGRIDRANHCIYMGGEMRFGYLSAEVRSFGRYAVCIDTVAPTIKPTFVKGANLSGKTSVSVIITDDRSGIRSYNGYIDGNWALFEYDAKNSILNYHFDETRIRKGTTHQLEMTVTDNRGNSRTVKSSFVW
jgi:hypothetical protein